MTYDARESSVQEGAPVELYEFVRNGSGSSPTQYFYTSAEQDFTVESQLYTSASIQRTAVETNTEQARNSLKLTVPRNFDVAELFRGHPPTDIIAVTVRRFHRGEESDMAVIWIGRVLNCSFEGARAILTCEPVSISLKRQGLRRLYQKQCPHVLYGPGCLVDKTLHDHVTVITAVDGVTVTVESLLAKPYAGGYLEFEDVDGNLERRFIRSASGNVLTLNFPFGNDIQSSDFVVVVYPGCNHTMPVCDTVYSNIPNYGGVSPYTPQKNPFDGTPIF